MDIKKTFSKKRILFVAVFMAVALIAQRINFSGLVGAENQYFTLFQFFGPIAGSFLGAFFGIISILAAEVIDFFVVGKALTLVNVLRLTPMLFAAYYFGTKGKKKITVAIPAVCMAIFMLHPVGRQVWFFSLYWTIPIIVKMLPVKYADNAFLKGLGATFTAHAIGGAIWIWTVPMTAGQWVGLIPIVAYERLLFAAGIAGSYVLMNTSIDLLVEKFRWKVGDILKVDKQYSLSKVLFKEHA